MTFKQSVVWTRVVDRLPENDKSYLVWTGKEMVVSCAHVYDDAHKKQLSEAADLHEKINGKPGSHNHMRTATGKFADFGVHWYFDNPNVYYAELPLAPGETNPPQPDPFDGMIGKDVYLKKGSQIVGIHAVGDFDPTTNTFYPMEVWGNEYDDEHNMLGRGSFRVFDSMENEVKNWEADGWVRYEGPKKKT